MHKIKEERDDEPRQAEKQCPRQRDGMAAVSMENPHNSNARECQLSNNLTRLSSALVIAVAGVVNSQRPGPRGPVLPVPGDSVFGRGPPGDGDGGLGVGAGAGEGRGAGAGAVGR